MNLIILQHYTIQNIETLKGYVICGKHEKL